MLLLCGVALAVMKVVATWLVAQRVDCMGREIMEELIVKWAELVMRVFDLRECIILQSKIDKLSTDMVVAAVLIMSDWVAPGGRIRSFCISY